MSKNISLSPKKLVASLAKSGRSIKKHSPLIFIVLTVSIYGYLFFRINQLSAAEPPPELITEKQNSIKRINIDEQAVEKIQQLEDQNISVRGLFKAARDNPFSE